MAFANLGSKPGVQDPSKVSEYYEAKRPPIDPPSYKDIPITAYRSEFGFGPETDKNGYKWIDFDDGDGPIYKGREVSTPTLKDFKAFLKKTGIKNDTDGHHSTLKEIWKSTSYSFLCVMDIKPVDYKFYAAMAEGFVYYNYTHSQISLSEPSSRELGNLTKGLKHSHDGTLTQVVGAYIYILDFWHNHRELHKSLWQCLCCGKFEVEQEVKGVRGRKRKYCSDECKKRFGLDSREKFRKSVSKHRDKLNEDKDKIAHDEIIDWLCNVGGYTPEKAEEIFNIEKHRNNTNVKSLANFKRTYGKRNGLI